MTAHADGSGTASDPWILTKLRALAWPWDVPLGTAVTVLVGMASSLVGQSTQKTAAA